MAGRREARRRLVDAVRKGDVARVTSILDEDPTLVDAANAHGNTPLGEAVCGGRLQLVQLLVGRGADPHQRNHGGTSLMDGAAASGSVEVARYLVECGCELNLLHAASLGDHDALSKLLKLDPDRLRRERDRRGSQAIHCAAAGGRVDTLRWLIDRGADVNARNRFGHEPLADAVEARAEDASRVLLDHGADANGRAGHFGGRVLHRAIVLRQHRLARLLLERGADVNATDFAGKTAAHEAISNGTKKMLSLVLDHGPDLDLRTRNTPTQPGGETALEYARRTKKDALVEMLLRAAG